MGDVDLSDAASRKASKSPHTAHDAKIAWMTKWARDRNATLTLAGECGFGRECVGILVGSIFPDYESWDGAFDNGKVWTPEDAYHKHPCVAVLGRGKKAETQLYKWLRWFDDNGFKLETGDNPRSEYEGLGALGILLGKNRYARMVRSPDGNLDRSQENAKAK